jgi:hypothetical protein
VSETVSSKRGAVAKTIVEREEETYQSPPLKQNGFFARSIRKCKCTYGFCRAIIERIEHFVQAFKSKSFEE